MATIDIPPLRSGHSPENIWNALKTPVPAELVPTALSPRVRINYEGLGRADQIQAGTRIIYVPRLGKLLDSTPEPIRDRLPDGVSVSVTALSDEDMIRTDVIDEGQMPRGELVYKVEEGANNTGLLVVEGRLAIEGFGGFWTLMGGDNLAIEHGIRRPAERFLEHVPQILGNQ